MSKQARIFTAALKPMWSEEEINDFLTKTTGALIAYIINHDKCRDLETLDKIEGHTHVYIEYTTPRKISTVANLLGVADNFVEIVNNKHAMLRYLTHKDDAEKFKYNDDEVYTNSAVTYSEAILGQTLSDKEIAQMIREGRGVDLLGVVPAHKLRTIQGFLHYEQSNRMYLQVKEMSEKLDRMSEGIDKTRELIDIFLASAADGVVDLVEALNVIGKSLDKVSRIGYRKK